MHEDSLRKITTVNNQALYAQLGVTDDADGAALKKAWRKASLKSHPDKGGTQELQARVQEAYEILTTPLLREVYDACGTEGLELLKQVQPKVRHAMQIDHICCVFCFDVKMLLAFAVRGLASKPAFYHV